MSKTIKIIAIISAAMIALGIILIGIGVATGGFRSIHYYPHEGFTVEPIHTWDKKNMAQETRDLESFADIEINLDFYNVNFVPGDRFQLEYSYYRDIGKPVIEVKDGKLIMEEPKEWSQWREGFNLFGGHYNNPQAAVMTLYYPETTQFNKVLVVTAAGGMSMKNLTAKEAEFELDLGKLTLEDLTADTLKIVSDAGDCQLKEVSVGKAELNMDLGSLKTTNFLTKGLKVTNDAGSIDLQGTFTGDSTISCDLGSITFATTLPEDEYNIDLNVNLGSASINGNSVHKDEIRNEHAQNSVTVDASAGDVRLKFGE